MLVCRETIIAAKAWEFGVRQGVGRTEPLRTRAGALVSSTGSEGPNLRRDTRHCRPTLGWEGRLARPLLVRLQSLTFGSHGGSNRGESYLAPLHDRSKASPSSGQDEYPHSGSVIDCWQHTALVYEARCLIDGFGLPPTALRAVLACPCLGRLQGLASFHGLLLSAKTLWVLNARDLLTLERESGLGQLGL